MKYMCLISLLLVLSSSVAGQKVAVNYDKTFNFANVKTYAWDRGMAARNPNIDRLIVAAVENELAARGLIKVESAADVIVVYAAAVGIDLHMTYASRGNSSGAPQQTGIPNADRGWTIPQGSLAVTFLNPTSKDLLWSGTATASLPAEPGKDLEKDAKRMEKTIKRAVEKMFKKYPVAAKT